MLGESTVCPGRDLDQPAARGDGDPQEDLGELILGHDTFADDVGCLEPSLAGRDGSLGAIADRSPRVGLELRRDVIGGDGRVSVVVEPEERGAELDASGVTLASLAVDGHAHLRTLSRGSIPRRRGDAQIVVINPTSFAVMAARRCRFVKSARVRWNAIVAPV